MKLMTVNTLVGIVQSAETLNELVQRTSGHKISGHSVESLAHQLRIFFFNPGSGIPRDLTMEEMDAKKRTEAFARALQSLIAAAQDLGEAPAAAGFLGRSK